MHSARMSILAGTALALILARDRKCRTAGVQRTVRSRRARLQHAGQHDEAVDADHADRQRSALPQHAARHRHRHRTATAQRRHATCAGRSRRESRARRARRRLRRRHRLLLRLQHQLSRCHRRRNRAKCRMRRPRPPTVRLHAVRGARCRALPRPAARTGPRRPACRTSRNRSHGRTSGRTRARVAAPGTRSRPAAARPLRPQSPRPPPMPRAETEVGDKIREILASKQFEQIAPRKPERDAIVALYQKTRGFKPLWVAAGAQSERASDALEYLRGIDADGLDPNDYPMPNLAVGSVEAQAEAELKFTAMLLTYVRHASTGRVHFSRVSPNIEYKLAFDADDALKKIAASNDLPKTLETFNPPQPAYQALERQARRAPQRAAGQCACHDPDRPDAQICPRPPDRPRDDHERCARAAAARASRPAAGEQPALQRRARQRGREIPEGEWHQADRRAHQRDDRGDEPAEPRPAGRRRARDDGALALGAARSRQDPRHAQHPGLSSAGL